MKLLSSNVPCTHVIYKFFALIEKTDSMLHFISENSAVVSVHSMEDVDVNEGELITRAEGAES